MPPTAYRAAWIFPVASPPLRDAVLEVDAAGRIAAIREGPDRDAIDLGNVAVVPALVNAHVHLEFSDLAEPIAPPLPFTSWVRNVVAHRRSRTEPASSVIRRGLRETRRVGAIAAGEIATTDESFPTDGIDLVLFRELIGPVEASWPDLLAAVDRHLHSQSPPPPGEGQGGGELVSTHPLILRGLSPHAPYTVPQELYEHAVDLAVRHDAPIAVHLAETESELRFLSRHQGEFVDLLHSLGLWRPNLHPLGRRPLDWLRPLAAVSRGLVVHGNYLDDEELDFLAAHDNLSLVYCPRTHAYFGHPPHPFRRILGHVALGTDGRSSNPDLDLWREGRFLHERHPTLPSDTILDLLTRRGAEALGLADRHGILAPGRRANFIAISIDDSADDLPPDLFAQSRGVRRVFRDGTELDPAAQHA